MNISKEILKGYIDTIILSFLYDKPLYGFEIAKLVRKRSNQEFELKEGTMYLALKRLESKGLVESFWSQETSDGGRRKYYRILPTGKDLLIQKKDEWKFVKRMLDLLLEVNDERN